MAGLERRPVSQPALIRRWLDALRERAAEDE
jgi:hypothetical protein